MGDRSPAEGTWLQAAREAGGTVVATVVALPDEQLAEVRDLYRLLDPALPAVERDAADAALAAAGVTVLAAVAPDGRVAGLVTLVVVPTLARTRAWAEDLVVHPKFRGRGVGKALMAACAEAAARAGARTIDGTVDPSRRAALALYLRAGWEVSPSLPIRLALGPGPATSCSTGTNR
jgi:GNAT superfamily N-acetyltransferase